MDWTKPFTGPTHEERMRVSGRADQAAKVKALQERMEKNRADLYGNASPEDFHKLAQAERDAAQNLIDLYGQGVRPAWVSTDIAINYEKARQFDLSATQLGAR